MPLFRRRVEADADTSHIRRQFYSEVAQGDRYWWWIRAERFGQDGAYLIVEDDEADELYRIDVTVNNDGVTFGDPIAVLVDYPTAAVAAGMAAADKAVVVYASRADTGGPDISDQEDDVKLKELAAAMGLPEDATEEQIMARARNVRAGKDDEEKDEEGPGEGIVDDDAGERPSPSPGQVQTGPATPLGDEDEINEEEEKNTKATVTIDRATYEHLKRGADAAIEASETRRNDEIGRIVNDAVKAGKFTPARREHYAKLLASDFEGGKTLIAELEPNTVPVTLRGTGGGGEGVGDAGDDGLPLTWFPEITELRARANSRQPVTHAKEG
jgi:hypothetical protein